MRYCLIFLLIYCLIPDCYAQFNDTTHYRVAFTPSGSVNSTRDGHSYLLNHKLAFNIKRNDISLNFNNSWIYGKQNTTLTNNDYSSSLDFNLYQNPKRLFYWGLVNYNTSHSLNINNQLLAGVGAAYIFIEDKNNYLNLSDGILYDLSDLQMPGEIRDVYHIYRNSLRLVFRFNITEIVVIDGTSFLQNSLDRHSDYIIRSTTNLSIKLRKWLSLTSSLNYARQNRTQSENLLLTYGISMEKYF